MYAYCICVKMKKRGREKKKKKKESHSFISQLLGSIFRVNGGRKRERAHTDANKNKQQRQKQQSRKSLTYRDIATKASMCIKAWTKTRNKEKKM